ncbi:MAG: ribosome biogenesis factor YjgA [Pseudomonadales bacterium]
MTRRNRTLSESAMTDSELDEKPSKSQRKRDMTAAQELGEQLLQLKVDVLQKMPLGERLLETLLQAQKMTQHEARRRHLQLIGKLMRDADVDAIQEAFLETQSGSAAATRALHELEHWRARLLQEGDAAITEALTVFPEMDVQQLRQLIREAKREISLAKPPAAARKLFQYLKRYQAQ